MSETELKPCPFCGGTKLKTGGDDKIVCVWCLTCQAAGPNHYGIREWNDRADFDARIRSALVVERKAEPVAWMRYGNGSISICFRNDEGAFPVFSTPPAEPVRMEGWTGKKCPHCNGHGVRADDDGEERRCPDCAGTGDEYGCKSVGPEGFFDDQFEKPLPDDDALKSAAREAGWALSTLVDEIRLEKRQQVVNIINRLSAALYALSASPAAPVTEVKPFDMTRLLRHAFDAGKDGGLWVDYDPTEFAPYLRIDAAIASVNHASLSQPSSPPEKLVEEIEILRAELSQARRHAFIEAAEMAEFLASEEDEEWRSDCGGTIETRLAGARSWAFGRIANILFDKAEKSLTALSTKEPSDA